MTIVPLFANSDNTRNTGSEQPVELFLGKLSELMDAFMKSADMDDLAASAARALKEDPQGAEIGLRDNLAVLGREVIKKGLENLDDAEYEIDRDGGPYRKMEPSKAEIQSLFGTIEYSRSRHRPAKGAAIVPVEEMIGVTECGMTPAAARLSTWMMSHMTARETEMMWQQLGQEGPSLSSLIRLTSEAGARFDAMSEPILKEIRASEPIPAAAASVAVMLDGVHVPMRAETDSEGNKTRDAGYREASCGVVSLLDDRGKILQSRYFGRMPESGMVTLKQQTRAEVFHLLDQRPDLKLVGIADGASTNWPFITGLHPDMELLDFYHAAEHLHDVATAAFGKGTDEAQSWFKKYRKILRDDAKGVGKVIDATRYLLKTHDNADIRRELAFFRKFRRRMQYKAASDAGFIIGSGPVESANKVLVTQRLKKSGQRWSHLGGQAVLSFRALVKSKRFDAAWDKVARTWRTWTQPVAANDNDLEMVQAA